MPIILKAATTAKEKDEVYRLRYQVFVEEEHRFEHPSDRIFDIYDTLEENVNFIAMENGVVVGSLRVTIDNAIGLPAMEHYDFLPYMKKTPGEFAGIGWLCIAERYRRHRGILPALFKMIVREAKKRGAKHLIAPLHPPILPLLRRFGAKPIDNEFLSGELKVPIVPIHIDFEDLPPGLREFSQDPADLFFSESNERRIYRQGEHIIEAGAKGTEAFLIMRGAVEVLVNPHDQQTRRVDGSGFTDKTHGNPLLGQGQLLGELSLIDGGPRTVSVIGHSKEVDLMVWTRDRFLEELENDNKKAIEMCKIVANRLRKQVEGYQQDESHDALVATILADASIEGKEKVDLTWLASQSAFRIKRMQELMQKWAKEGIVSFVDEKTIQVTDPKGLKEKIIWK